MQTHKHIHFAATSVLYAALLAILVGLGACNPTVTPTTSVTIEQLKSADFQKYIGQDVKVEGYLVYTTGKGAILLKDMSLMGVNRAYNETDYVNIGDEIYDKYLANKEQELYGAKVLLTGKVQQSKSQSVLQMLDLLGASSAVELVLTVNPQVLSPRGNFTPPTAYNFCETHPDACTTVWQSPADHYAILYSGGLNRANAHIRYWNDIKFMYRTLKKYGYTDDRIVVVYKNGFHDDPPTFVPEVAVDYAATPTGLTQAFDYLRGQMDANDQLFVFTTNHGGGFHQGEGVNYSGDADGNGDEVDPFQLDETMFYYEQNMRLPDDVFATQLNSLTFGTLIAVMEPCFSGGFLRDLRGNNRILISAANEFEFSYSDFWANYDEFVFHFTSALNGFEPQNLLGTPPVNADYNADGKVSMLEAFQYAKSKDGKPENPQYDDNGDGLGTGFPTSSGTDGSFGAFVFL